MSAIDRLNIKGNKFETQPPSESQDQTKSTFGFKWSKRETYESKEVKENARRWLFERYCGNDPRKLEEWLSGGRKIILDAGCGSGFSGLLFFGEHLNNHDYLGIDISEAVWVAQSRFREAGIAGDFLQTGIQEAPIPDSSIDMIFSEGVLHHTDSTEKAVKHLARKLKPGGIFLFYVYAKKGPIREFTDDFIRQKLQPLSDQEAWTALESLTRLGQELGKLNLQIDIPEDIPFLEMKKGKIDLQRFFYWHVCKMYYRPELNLDEMNHINFDWFRPLNCHRQTPGEVEQWCREASLTIERENVQEAGITIIARRAGC